jgi:hypothetical protein
MKFNVPADFCNMDSAKKATILQSAESALREKDKVFFEDKHFTNFDELKSFLLERCKQVESNHDWPGEIIDDIG